MSPKLLTRYGIAREELIKLVRVPGYTTHAEFRLLALKAKLGQVVIDKIGSSNLSIEVDAAEIVDWCNDNDDPQVLIRLLEVLPTYYDGEAIEKRIAELIKRLQSPPDNPALFRQAKLRSVTSPLLDRTPIRSRAVRLEWRWQISQDLLDVKLSHPIDLDFVMYVCYANPKDYWNYDLAYAEDIEDILYYPREHHVYPHASDIHTAAIYRSDDDLAGGHIRKADEWAEIDFSRLPANVIRIGVYAHLFMGSRYTVRYPDGQITQQLFKHATIGLSVISKEDETDIKKLVIGHEHPNNWGMDVCEFRKDYTREWYLLEKLHPLNGDSKEAAYSIYGPHP